MDTLPALRRFLAPLFTSMLVAMAQFPALVAAQVPTGRLAAPAGAHASAHSLQLAAALRAFAEREALAQLANAGHAAAARVEVTGGQLDARVQLAPCARTEAFAPGGTRYWGRASVGLRCVDGAAWSVLVPVHVRVFGPALVAARPLAASMPIGADDVRVAEVEWTREAQGVVVDAAQLEQRVPARPLPAGLPIPLAALRSPQAVGQGDVVKVVGNGAGFSISTSAVALATAADGQSVRVRTDSGRVLTGTARAGRVVEVLF
jgi:flagella basal body P-ring formation protein FlgA